MSFKDHFSTQSADYARFRPRYSDELFAFVAAIAPAHELAWDCATGNGQAATGLAAHFAEVIATDASAKQIENAERHPRVRYNVARAEQSNLESHSCDAIMVAQALHWFDLTAFYAEAKRVLNAGGALVVSSYLHLQISPEIDAIVRRYYHDTVGPYWPPERSLVEKGLAAYPFPFTELPTPALGMTTTWSLDALLGYLGTWSSTQRYRQARGIDPLELIKGELREAWDLAPSTPRTVTWPFEVRAGRAAA